MSDPWQHYDQWKLRSPEDEEDEQLRRLQSDPDDLADILYQRYKEGDLPEIDDANH